MFQRNTQIYKIWRADLWKRPSCESLIIFGFADKPMAIHNDKEAMKAALEEVLNLEIQGKVFHSNEYFGK